MTGTFTPMNLLCRISVFALWLISAIIFLAGAARFTLALLVPGWELGTPGRTVAAVCLLAGSGGLFAMSKKSVRESIQQHTDKIAVLIGSIFVSAAFMEFVLSLAIPRVPDFLQHDPVIGWKPRPNVSGRVPERLGQAPYSLSVDSNGFVNGVAGTGSRLLLLLGDSMLWPYFEPDDSPPAVFARYAQAPIRIANASITTVGTDQELLRLREIVQKNLNVTDLAFFFLPFNDYHNNVQPLIEMKGIGPVQKPIFILKGNKLELRPPAPEPFDRLSKPPLEISGLYRAWNVLRNAWESRSAPDTGYALDRDHKVDSTTFLYQLYSTNHTVPFRSACTLTSMLIENIKTLCDSAGIVLKAYAFESPVYVRYARADLGNQHELNRAEACMRETVARTFADARVAFKWIRLEENEMIPNDIHPNKAGMHKIARLVMRDVLEASESSSQGSLSYADR
jgi:lysophospholipase L1-like esterase